MKTMDTFLSSQYASFIIATRFENLPQEAINHAKKCVLDLFGVAYAGYTLTPLPQKLFPLFTEWGGKPEASVFCCAQKIPAPQAAFLNAICSHALDMDDGHRFAALHPGTVIIPAALAAAEISHGSTQDFLVGVIVGYEIMIRLGMALNPSSLNRGFHATGVLGTFGAAAATASILKLTHEQTINALSLAGLQSSGLLQVNHESQGSEIKPLNPARAAQSGLLASLFAKKNIQGPQQIFEGKDGFFKAFADSVDEEKLTKELGGEAFEICRTYLKFYSACRHAHPAIDAAHDICTHRRIEPSAIESIEVETYPAALRLAGIENPTTVSGARFSIPFGLALTILRGGATAQHFTQKNVDNRDIQELASKTKLIESSRWKNAYPQQRGATVTIFHNSGECWIKEVELAKGEPENPATWTDVEKKFIENTQTIFSKNKAQRFCSTLRNLENIDGDVAVLIRFMSLQTLGDDSGNLPPTG